MSELQMPLPSAPVLRAALKHTTDRLAAELVAPSAAPPAWSEFEWRVAMAVSVMHGISGLLAGRMRWAGVPHWRTFLDEQLEQGRRRERRARDLLARLDASAREAGVPLLGLKGSALLALGLYAPGERPMSDVDLLARPEDAVAADRLISSLGYVVHSDWDRHRVYEPEHWGRDRGFGEHELNPTKIELHPAVDEPLPLQEIDITAALLPPDFRPGLNPYAGSAALLRHLLLHTAGNLRHRNVRLIQLHDIAVLGDRLDAEGWAQALAPASDGRPAWWAVPPLALARKQFPGRLQAPGLDQALAPALAACPPALLRQVAEDGLVEWSASHLDLPRLPGLAWTHSATEAVGYAFRRAVPRRQDRLAGQQAVQHEDWLAGSAWAHQPRWLKALRLLFGSAPRVVTLYNLHRALAYRPSSSA
jgi:hypothetical protein